MPHPKKFTDSGSTTETDLHLLCILAKPVLKMSPRNFGNTEKMSDDSVAVKTTVLPHIYQNSRGSLWTQI